ncbi:IS4 family transposase, partial [Myroides marinus]|nr:IS4 family transposase [Myroides marinus]
LYVAISTYCLVAIVQKDMQLDRSTYEILQILSISLTDKTQLKDLFNKTKFQNNKERNRLNEPSLFDF